MQPCLGKPEVLVVTTVRLVKALTDQISQPSNHAYGCTWLDVGCAQAMDRCHRIGQQKPVLVFRLATALSVEGKLLRRANSKLALERLVIKKGAFLPGQVCCTCCSVLGCCLLPSIGDRSLQLCSALMHSPV